MRIDGLQAEIVRLLQNGSMNAGAIRNKLNGQGWDVSQDEVLRALSGLEAHSTVEALWQINRKPMQTPTDITPDRSQN